MNIVALAGGIGGARFLRGLRAAAPEADITVIGNTADDITLSGLRICPDLDTVMYTLGGGIHEEQGWGRSDERFTIDEELRAYGSAVSWFTLGDRDIATHIVRTQMLASGHTLSEVTDHLCQRWRPGVRLIPMSDDRVETHVDIEDGGGVRTVHFQEYWVHMHAKPPVIAVAPIGAESAVPAPGVLEAINDATLILFPPSNPVVSIGTILAVPGIPEAITATSAPVIGVSPIVAGAVVRGMADKLLPAIGVDTSAAAVARHYGPGLLDGWLVDETDKDSVSTVEDAGIACRAVPLMMTSVEATAAMATAAIALAAEVRGA